MAEEKPIGKITHFYGKLMVAIIDLTAPLKVGDTIHIKGTSDDFTQQVEQLQFDHKDIKQATAGQQVGVKVNQKIHDNDQVYLVV
jgi:putative protease